METATEQQIQITPYAILAAILFNLDKTETVKVKPDDQQDEIEVLSDCVGLVVQDEALVCMIRMDKIMHFATSTYNFQFKVEDGHAIISFDKASPAPTLVAANGQAIIHESPLIKELTERLK